MTRRIIRIIINLLTWPGVPLHEFAHAWACRQCGVRVHRVCYLRLGNPRGFVIHDRPDTSLQHIFISVAPFLVCSVFSFLIGLGAQSAAQYHMIPLEYENVTMALSLWIGWAIGANSFPSGGDADSLWRSAWGPGTGLFSKLLIIPVVAMIRLGQIGAYVWLDLLWGIVTVLLGPAAVLWFLAERVAN